ncbi:methyl-accepting chemotaxis protein [Trichlorobacter thiogenes]|uniref:Methyl-accepting chemotaxis protein n=1 Tax=Trichlorobacter thiogenes TaxID=115783 RepID=A0A1T4LPC0_9BACT|nr:methyl-accepting chemotaxis protein [Trichlorobacter thiogenes]SJZ56582.1 methyl-accepting chemotaxis protein [Trichlorobacter thiogenes]
MQWFKNLKVGVKLVAGFVTVAIIAAVVGAIGIMKIYEIDHDAAMMYEKMTVPLGDLGAISVDFQRARINLRDVVESTDPAERQKYADNIKKLRQDMTEHAEKVEKTLLTEEGRKAFNEFKESRKVYGGFIDKILELDNAGKDAEAKALMHGEAFKAALHEQEIINQLVDSKKKQAKLAAEHNDQTASFAAKLMIGVIIAAVVLAITLGLLISRMITTPLAASVAVARRLADGDLTAEVTVTSRDEVGQLQSAMEHMVQSLRTLVSQTVQISAGIASASTQLHSTSEQIATGAEEVAAQTGTVATASEEMAATSSDIARNCHAAADSAGMAATATESGFAIVKHTVDGIRTRGEHTKENAKIVSSLGERSEQIGAIVGTIEDIADQTNLLALNAAIEAARAGEMGRGFAVVADEVRALAERTTKATKEISDMIRSIQQETRVAITSMEEGVKGTEKGAAEAAQLETSLQQILEQVNDVTMQVSQIATAAEQQTATTSEVTTNIQQITEVVQQTASGAEETAAAAAQLAGQAQDLQNLVSKFKL